METDEIYSTEEIIQVAEKVVENILKEGSSIVSCISKADWFHKGPLSWFVFYSKRCNPRGKYAIDIEALSIKQKAIVIELVGQAIPRLGIKGEKSEFMVSNYISKQNIEKSETKGFSRLEMQEMKERGIMDTILRAINSK